MSKAFTRESDSDFSETLRPPRPLLPPGAKNYITRDGADRLVIERQEQSEARSRLLGLPKSAENQEQIAKIEARLEQLDEILASMVVVDPPAAQDKVRFGAYVTVRDGREESVFRIVGIDEIDLDKGFISWQSPLAKALINKSTGEHASWGVGPNVRSVQIVDIKYQGGGSIPPKSS